MYSFVDRPSDRLISGSHFLLWAMRGWVLSATQNRCPAVTLAPSFSQMGLLEHLGDFHELMLRFHREGRCIMAFATLQDPTINEIEAVMLSMWRDVVEGRHDRVRAGLGLMIAERGIDPMLAAMVRIAVHMSTLGLAPSGIRHASDLLSDRIDRAT